MGWRAKSSTAYRHRNARSACPRLTTTNHHEIESCYLANSFLFFIIGGVLALLMRTELATRDRRSSMQHVFRIVHDARDHDDFLVSIPILAGFGNLMVRRSSVRRHGVPADQRP